MSFILFQGPLAQAHYVDNLHKLLPKSVILFGGAGNGKTTLPYFLAYQFKYSVMKINAGQIKDKWLGKKNAVDDVIYTWA